MNRLPILLRTPIVHRVSIFQRHSVFCRIPVMNRVPVPIQKSKFFSCSLCYRNNDCYGNFYGGEHVLIIHRARKDSISDTIQKIQQAQHQGRVIRLIINGVVPEELIWAASYDENNILQLNVLMYSKSFYWVSRMAVVADKCGMYVHLFIFPVVPNTIHTYDVLKVLDLVRMIPYQTVFIQFAKSRSELLSADGYSNVNGVAVQNEYLQKIHGELWGCSSLFIDEFIEYLNNYAVPRGMKIEVCSNNTNCLVIK